MRFVDSNVFVYHFASDPAYGEKASSILEKIGRGEEECVTSTLVISQVCGYMKWRKKADAIPPFLALLRSLPNMAKTKTTFGDFALSEELRGNLSWASWDDLVIAAQMRRVGAREIYSNDTDFDSIPGIKRVF